MKRAIYFLAAILCLIILGTMAADLISDILDRGKRMPATEESLKTIEDLREKLRRSEEMLKIVSNERSALWQKQGEILRKYCGTIDHVAAMMVDVVAVCLDSMAIAALQAGWKPPQPWVFPTGSATPRR